MDRCLFAAALAAVARRTPAAQAAFARCHLPPLPMNPSESRTLARRTIEAARPMLARLNPLQH